MNITSITVVLEDGSILTTSGPFTPVTSPTAEQIAQIDVVNTDGSTEKFVPEAPATDTPTA